MISPQQFRASVDSRLSGVATTTGRTINRTRNLLVMERFLIRMVAVAPEAFILKGGLALELRLSRARTTADVDVLARGTADDAEGGSLGKWLTKPVASLGFLGVAALRLTQGTMAAPLLLVGMALCAVGDALLISKDKRAFPAGIGAFLMGHVVYAAVFYRRGLDTAALALVAAPLALVAWRVGRWLWPSLSAAHPKMRLPVVAYISVITVMMALAIGTWAFQRNDGLLAGAALFFVSDLFVARNRFVAPGFANRLTGLPLYYGGQCLIAWNG